MSLLAPAFLAGLGLLVVPIIIHLTQRQRSEVTAFPSLMFLRRVPFKTTSRRRIRNPLLFALRCAAIALLALAFARPFFERGEASAGEDARDVVILIDTSASLRYENRWSAALERARDALSGLREGDRAAIVTFARAAEERASLTADVDLLSAVLDGLRPTDLDTRLEAGLQLAGRVLAESDRASKEVVLISDFQRTGWEDEGRVRLPDGVALRAESVADGRDANLAVADASLTTGSGGRARVVARVANMGEEAARAVPVTLELGGRAISSTTADVPPRGAATVAFDGIALPASASRGRVSIAADGLVLDDALHFMAAPERGLEVLVLEGRRGRSDRSLFLTQAISLGESPRMRATRRPAGQLDGATLATAGAVVLNDVDELDAGRAGRLREWVEAGGALVIVLGANADPRQWSEAGAALVGGTVEGIEDRAARGGTRLAWLDYDHPVFEVFAAPRSGDFSEARFFRFRAVEPAAGTRVLARFEEGRPALLEHVLGEGRVLVWTSSVDRFWNDLALQPVYLPFVHRLLLYATSYREPRRWVAAGSVMPLEELIGAGFGGGDEAEAAQWVLVTPAGERRPVSAGTGPAWVAFDAAGFYEIQSLESPARSVAVAVNAPLEESDLSTVAPERVVEAVVGAGVAASEAAPEALAEAAPQAPARRELWWPLVVLAVLVLGAESVIANRWTRRRVAAGPRLGMRGGANG